MEKVLIKNVKTVSEKGENLNLNYFLTEIKGEFGTEYGVLVSLENEIYNDSCCAKTITTIKENCLKFIEEISENKVTPTSFYEILDDYLGIKI